MKFHFTEAERGWVHMATTRMLMFLGPQSERPLIRQVSKLHYKFGPGGTTVFLKAKEADLLMNVALSRLGSLKETGSVSEELDVVGSVMKKLGGVHALSGTDTQ